MLQFNFPSFFNRCLHGRSWGCTVACGGCLDTVPPEFILQHLMKIMVLCICCHQPLALHVFKKWSLDNIVIICCNRPVGVLNCVACQMVGVYCIRNFQIRQAVSHRQYKHCIQSIYFTVTVHHLCSFHCTFLWEKPHRSGISAEQNKPQKELASTIPPR